MSITNAISRSATQKPNSMVPDTVVPDTVVPEIQDAIADTLFIPLSMRAKLTEQQTGIIHDSSALQLVSRIDYDFERYQQADMSRVGCGVRADYFDQFCITRIHKACQQKRHLAIVSLGCGLDDRYQRINEQIGAAKTQSDYLHFYEMDLPEVMALRAALLPKADNQTYISGSIFDHQWINSILTDLRATDLKQSVAQESAANETAAVDFVFLLEGVLMYFNEDKVAGFFVHLANAMSSVSSSANSKQGSEKNLEQGFKVGEVDIVFDAMTKFVVKMSRKHDALSKTNVDFQWAMDDDEVVSDWDNRYQLKDLTYMMSLKPKQWPAKTRVIRLIPFMYKSSKILTYSLNI